MSLKNGIGVSLSLIIHDRLRVKGGSAWRKQNDRSIDEERAPPQAGAPPGGGPGAYPGWVDAGGAQPGSDRWYFNRDFPGKSIARHRAGEPGIGRRWDDPTGYSHQPGPD